MGISRRNLLRSMGVLAAARPVSAFAGISPMDQAPMSAAAKAPVVTVIFEGPWLFTQDKQKNFVATTFDSIAMTGMNIPHICSVGTWDPTAKSGWIDYPGLGSGYKLPANAVWKVQKVGGKVNPAKFGVIMGSPLNSLPTSPVMFTSPDFSLVTTSGDKQIILPKPDQVCMGGQLMNSHVLDGSSGTLRDTRMKPCVATILQYTDPGIAIDFGTTPDGAKPTPLSSASQLIIFRMSHDPKYDDGGNGTHPVASFQGLISRVALNNIYMQTSDDLPDTTTVCGISAAEMGVTGYKMSYVRESHDRPFHQNYANCAGGGVAADDGN